MYKIYGNLHNLHLLKVTIAPFTMIFQGGDLILTESYRGGMGGQFGSTSIAIKIITTNQTLENTCRQGCILINTSVWTEFGCKVKMR